MGIAGESGSGKSLTAQAILGLLPSGLAVTKGRIELNGTNMLSQSEGERRRLRGKDIAYMFQNYQESFTPFLTIGSQLVETLSSHERVPKKQAKHTALLWLEKVKLPAEKVFHSYPFQLSGGQLQRASLAAALMLKPSLLIADEPTTALDVLNGENVLNLLRELQKETGCAVLLISHNLFHLAKRADTLGVMFGGRMVEVGKTEQLVHHAVHPYAKLLFQAKPVLSRRMPDQLITIPGEPGAVAKKGCPFSLRCPFRIAECDHLPAMRETAQGSQHFAACQLLEGGEVLHETAAARDQAD